MKPIACVNRWFQGKLAREYAVHRGEVLCIEKDGDTLFSGGSDQAVRVCGVRCERMIDVCVCGCVGVCYECARRQAICFVSRVCCHRLHLVCVSDVDACRQHGPIRAINVFGNKLCIATGNAIRVQTVDR